MRIVTTGRFWWCCIAVLSILAVPALAEHHEVEHAATDDGSMAHDESMAHGEMAHGEMAHGEMAPAMDPAMMEAWAMAATPGEAHQGLADSVGSWSASVTMWMEPGAEPMTSAGTFEREMILGGRVLSEHFTGDFMGQPFHGYGLTGYDNVTGRYWSVWADDMSTGPMISWGDWEEEVGGLVFVGEMSDPMSGARSTAKSVVKSLEDGTEVFEMYEMREGGEAKTMEIRSVRQ